jgi:hypothetical protein
MEGRTKAQTEKQIDRQRDKEVKKLIIGFCNSATAPKNPTTLGSSWNLNPKVF